MNKDQEISILIQLLDKLKIYDIQLSHDESGILQARDEDGNSWAGKEFYRFLTEECLCFDKNGNLAWGQFVPTEVLEPYKELLKNLTVTIIGVAAGAAGGYGGAALGTLIAPGAGTAIGGILGSLLAGTLGSLAAEALIAPFYESDAEEMYNIISEEFLALCEEYLISESEGTSITEKLKSKLVGDTLKDMYASENRNQFARELMEPLFVDQVSMREQIKMPTEAELRVEMKDALQGIVFVH